MADAPDSNANAPTNLERLAAQDQPTLLAEMFEFLKYNKKWWLLPILLIMGLFGILLILAGTSVAPFIYTLF
jgi:Family of unknown function (DUF5989)